MSKRVVHFIIESSSFNLSLEYSVVSQVVKSFINLLEQENWVVYINGEKFDEKKVSSTPQNGSSKNSPPPIYRLAPKKVRETVKDIQLRKKLASNRDKILNQKEGDLVINWVSRFSDIAANLAKKLNIPLVSIYDNPLNEEYEYGTGFRSFFYNKVERVENKALNSSDLIITYSPAVTDYLKNKFSLDKFFYNKAFCDFSKMMAEPVERSYDAFRFIYVGSFFKWHKVPKLIEDFELFSIKEPESSLTLVGNGPEFFRVKNIVKQKKLNEKVKFTGRLSGEQLNQELEHANLAILPHSLWFQAPVKLFQYFSASLPVIAFHTSTVEFLTKNSTSISFYNSEKPFNRVLVELDLQKIKEASKGAFSYYQKYFGPASFSDLIKTLNELIGGR